MGPSAVVPSLTVDPLQDSWTLTGKAWCRGSCAHARVRSGVGRGWLDNSSLNLGILALGAQGGFLEPTTTIITIMATISLVTVWSIGKHLQCGWYNCLPFAEEDTEAQCRIGRKDTHSVR